MKEERTEKKALRPKWWWGVLIGIAFLGLGGLLDQFDDIFLKATRICLECIGIG